MRRLFATGRNGPRPRPRPSACRLRESLVFSFARLAVMHVTAVGEAAGAGNHVAVVTDILKIFFGPVGLEQLDRAVLVGHFLAMHKRRVKKCMGRAALRQHQIIAMRKCMAGGLARRGIAGIGFVCAAMDHGRHLMMATNLASAEIAFRTFFFASYHTPCGFVLSSSKWGRVRWLAVSRHFRDGFACR